MPAYQAPAHQQPAPVATGGSGMATAAMVLGILAVLTCWTVWGGVLLGLLAIIFGAIAARRARLTGLGRGRAISGIVTGVIGLLLSVVLIAVGVSILNSPAGKNLRSCLKDAGSNQQQVQQCQNQYRDQVGTNG
ncbi:MAG TPA: DUF4190 domain-containing protein [Jatrophihabitans sp.]|nr:DUF4190 domain-containing protein [Jatrophihabitans sp.]